MGRSPGQAGAPQALRAAGLETALPTAELTCDVILPAPTSARGPAGFINEPALLVMVDTVYSRVGHSLRTGRFPLLYGADCAVLLAAIPALCDATGRAGLLFLDAHEDATTMEQSDTGEAASMEIALLLGLTGTYAPEPLRSRLPALDRDTIVMLGQRDHLYRRQIGVPTVAGQVPLHPLEELHGDPAGIATDAAGYLVRHTHGWWLHIDLDVLADLLSPVLTGQVRARLGPLIPTQAGAARPRCVVSRARRAVASARRPGAAPVEYAGSSGRPPRDPVAGRPRPMIASGETAAGAARLRR